MRVPCAYLWRSLIVEEMAIPVECKYDYQVERRVGAAKVKGTSESSRSHHRLRRGMLFSLRLPLFHWQCCTIPFLDATLNYWLHSCWTPCERASSQLTRFRSFFFFYELDQCVCRQCLQTVPSPNTIQTWLSY